MVQIFPVLLAGGYGTRLWPVSRKSFPKQFSNNFGDMTLFQRTTLRLTDSRHIKFHNPIVVTQFDFRFIVRDQLEAVGITPLATLLEPSAKNTAAPILAAAIVAQQSCPQARILIAPSDHAIDDVKQFHCAIAKGVDAVDKGDIVTFGIPVTRAETGYGYMRLSSQGDDIAQVEQFIEKPKAAVAETMMTGDFVWNSGIFLARACDIITAFDQHEPELAKHVRQSLDDADCDLGFVRLAPEAWEKCRDVSIDYAVMERSRRLACVPLLAGWADLGDWGGVWAQYRDDGGISASVNTTLIDCENALVYSDPTGPHIVGLGLRDIIAVASGDAILLADKSRAQDVKKAVDVLRQKNLAQADKFTVDHRPWGSFDRLASGERFQVKQIHVKPGAMLSLQSHHHRSEHWIVVAGTAQVTVDDQISLISEGQSIYVPLGAKHRLENPGKVPVILIEVQTGRYLEEDDIIRYDDVYARA